VKPVANNNVNHSKKLPIEQPGLQSLNTTSHTAISVRIIPNISPGLPLTPVLPGIKDNSTRSISEEYPQ
jgi:hypothetical protein